MPAFIGNMKVLNVSNSSTVSVGDVGFITLSSASKIYAGANSFPIGDNFVGAAQNTFNQGSSTNTLDPDLIDSSPTRLL